MEGLVFIGCGPEVGTTAVAGGCAVVLRRGGLRPGVFKPVATKCERRQRQGLVSPDAEFLAHCADTPLPLEVVNPIRFADALPPESAAKRARRPIDLRHIRRALRQLAPMHDRVLVDAGPGLLWPLAPGRVMADLLAEWRWPVVLVARSDPGVVNELLVHAEAARSRGLRVSATVINLYSPDAATLAEETASDLIASHGRLPLPAVVPRDRRTSIRRGTVGPSTLYPLQKLLEAVGWAGR